MGQSCVTDWGSFALLQTRVNTVTNWGSCYKLGQPPLQNRASITNWSKIYYKLEHKIFYKNSKSIVIDEEEHYILKEINNTDHDTIIIEIQKDVAKIEKQNKILWKINSETIWHKYQQRLQCKPTKDETNTHEDVDMTDNI